MAFILVSGVALLFGHKLFVSEFIMFTTDRIYFYFDRLLFDTYPSDLVLMRRYVQEDSSLSESDVFALLSFIDFLICHYN